MTAETPATFIRSGVSPEVMLRVRITLPRPLHHRVARHKHQTSM